MANNFEYQVGQSLTGTETLNITDSAGDDTLTAAGNYAEMSYAAGQPTSRIRVTAFDLVYANGNAGARIVTRTSP